MNDEPDTLNPGRFYLTLACANCGKQLCAETESEPTGGELKCPECSILYRVTIVDGRWNIEAIVP